MSGDEFAQLQEQARQGGRYIRRWDVRGGRYRVRRKDIIKRCEPAVAQLWFDVMRSVSS